MLAVGVCSPFIITEKAASMNALISNTSNAQTSFNCRPRLQLIRVRPIVPAAPVQPASHHQHVLSHQVLLVPAAGSASTGVPAGGSDPTGGSSGNSSGAAGSSDATPVQRNFWQQIKRFFIGEHSTKVC